MRVLVQSLEYQQVLGIISPNWGKVVDGRMSTLGCRIRGTLSHPKADVVFDAACRRRRGLGLLRRYAENAFLKLAQIVKLKFTVVVLQWCAENLSPMPMVN